MTVIHTYLKQTPLYQGLTVIYFYFSEAFAAEALVGQAEVFFIDFTSYEVVSHLVGRYAAATATEVRIQDFTPPLCRKCLIYKHIAPQAFA